MKRFILAIACSVLSSCSPDTDLSVLNASYSFLDLGPRNPSAALAQDPWDLQKINRSCNKINSIVQGTTTLNCEARSQGGRRSAVNKIILHNTEESLVDTIGIFTTGFPFRRNNWGSPRNVSIHYVIGRDGTIVKNVPENSVAYHAGNANSNSIGIEIVASVHNPEASMRASGMTAIQYRSLLVVMNQIMRSYGINERNVESHRGAAGSGTQCPRSIWDHMGGKGTDPFNQWRQELLKPHLDCASRFADNMKGFFDCIQPTYTRSKL